MAFSRLQIKVFAAEAGAVDMQAFIGLFQRWIQQKKLPGLLLDVVDYRHVFQGPGVVLIGHESDYGIDMGAGRLGLLYTQKRRPDSDPRSQLESAFFYTLTACRLLESEPSPAGKLTFRTDEVEIRFLDRLNYANTPETLERVREDVTAVLSDLYGETPFSFAATSADPRHMLTLRVEAAGAGSAEALLRRHDR